MKSELIRLYQRKLVVDELIRSLERYAASEARQPALKVTTPRAPVPIPIRSIA